LAVEREDWGLEENLNLGNGRAIIEDHVFGAQG